MSIDLWNYYNENQDRIDSSWREHLSDIRCTDSAEHYALVMKNEDVLFWEYVEDMKYEDEARAA